jgi:dynein heavy chain, axonemal
MVEVSLRYPQSHSESLNMVLQQECMRYNHLLSVIEATLQETVRGLRGQVVLTPALEAVLDAVLINQVSRAGRKSKFEHPWKWA